jgi:hypothetical protein
MVLCTYSRSGVKKGLVDGDLGPNAMVQPFVLLHENFTTPKKSIVRQTSGLHILPSTALTFTSKSALHST